MSRLPGIALAVGVASLLVARRGHIARLVRTIDRRAGIFAPHGACLYNAVAPVLLRPLYRRAAADVAALASRDTPAIDVLEIGSGPGELALAIAQRLPRAEVLGVDLASAMVDRATERAREAGMHMRVRFRLADAARLPLADGSFDVAVSTLSLHHWADPGSVFTELGRVLRPTGVALVYDVRPFAYLRHEIEGFLAGTAFEDSHVERDLVGSGPLPAAFVRIRLMRPVR